MTDEDAYGMSPAQRQEIERLEDIVLRRRANREAKTEADRKVNRRTVEWCLVCYGPDCGNENHERLGGVSFCDLCKRNKPCDECRSRNG